MLIRFSCENFLSFQDEAEFSMVAGRTLRHKTHVVADKKVRGPKLLKAAVIYGANASGKSNFVRAMRFAKQRVVSGTKPKRKILYKPFLLDTVSKAKPSKFEFEIRINDTNFNYGFVLDANRVHEEWLYRIGSSVEEVIFERRTDAADVTSVEFGNIKYENQEQKKLVEFTAKGTRPNQLFLTESVERDLKQFESIFNWFDKSLVFIFPDTRFIGLEHKFQTDDAFGKSLVNYLKLFDIGVTGVTLNERNLDEESLIPMSLRNQIVEDLVSNKNEDAKSMVQGPNGQRLLLTKTDVGDVKSFKLMTTHKVVNGDAEVEFDVADESDGTRRLLDLIPGLLSLLDQERVFVVDELDRSLHPQLSRKIVELFLSNRIQQPSQLIVTTHESSLLDLELLRRDEIWFVEKSPEGLSKIYSLEEFAPRYDKDIRKGYLHGRFGAIPLIRNVNNLKWIKQS